MKSNTQLINWSILLHDIRSVQNVASIFRLAEILGVNTIYLSGVTPGPLDRFGFERKDFTKISLGTEKEIKWKRLEEMAENQNSQVFDFLKEFKNEGGVVIALEQNEKSKDYKVVGEIIKKDFLDKKDKKYLIIPGREVEGLDMKILKECDVICEISQYGKKESLNIFSAMSIACYRFFDF